MGMGGWWHSPVQLQWGGRDWGLELTPWFNSGQLTHKSELLNNPRDLGRCPQQEQGNKAARSPFCREISLWEPFPASVEGTGGTGCHWDISP